MSNPKVAEAAVVGASDPVTGQGIVAFVILRSEAGDGGDHVVRELRQHVAQQIGKIAQPLRMIVAELPKTRSGKIMRRLLRDVAENRAIGDVTTWPTRASCRRSRTASRAGCMTIDRHRAGGTFDSGYARSPRARSNP